ncbi:acetyl-CoA carboxylase biotin carboxyl carrier protein [Dysosmobacter sp. Sow4_B12]|uniref:acetyl-CoA carboxylase biotin carboxyl carrier protein n=1 Tax=Dysosmobacter sp. Sow4_B12 TaxID=3438777 RepID=UPI003F8E53E4
MTNQEIFDLMDRFQRSSLRAMKLSCQDFSIELEQGAAAAPAAAAPAAVPAPPAAAPAPQAEGPVISAPLVGTYYAAPAPEQPPFVAAGDRVKKGQTVCLIEAMKMMSEVPAPCDCVIEEVLKANGELAAFGEALFRYRPC